MDTETGPVLASCTMPSTLGDLILVWNNNGLLAVEFSDHRRRIEQFLQRNALIVSNHESGEGNLYVEALTKYFEGETDVISRLPVEMIGAAFQVEVWEALRTIPRGETRSYGQIAQAIGRPGAARAVGAANGQNPIGIVVPCHRVIGSTGKLTGYAGGVDRKRWLLEHEGALECSPLQAGLW